MPYGMIKWFDPRSGKAEVARGGRLYAARAGDIESVARRAGARVHFDIRRELGGERAVDVRLREGTRVSHKQHNFGTLVGARSIETKGPVPHGRVHPELRQAATHPLEVARAWATSVSQGDIVGALVLYSADPVLHVDGHDLVGRSEIATWVEGSRVFGCKHHARIQGGEVQVTVLWDAAGSSESGTTVQCMIDHAQIAEQWVSRSEAAVPNFVAEAGPLQIQLSTRGAVDEDAKATAQVAVHRMVEELEEPVLFARLKLAFEPDPARRRRAVAQASLDVDGDLVRAHVAAHTMPEAIDLLVYRLRDRLDHRATYGKFVRHRDPVPEPGEWRHGDLHTIRPAYFDRPAEDRQLVRHKTFALGELFPDEAVFDMEQFDYDFYLFCDLASGADSMMERLEDGSYRLTRVVPSDTVPSDTDLVPTVERVVVSAVPPPTLTLEQAVERLDSGGEPHVFFADAASGRGSVLYRRYDGHYGLIVPA
ncbi:MAG: sigma 54 modulation/S30EA ribosomal C-terminal domain-containing protein [Acidimicrobiales bacterium]